MKINSFETYEEALKLLMNYEIQNGKINEELIKRIKAAEYGKRTEVGKGLELKCLVELTAEDDKKGRAYYNFHANGFQIEYSAEYNSIESLVKGIQEYLIMQSRASCGSEISPIFYTVNETTEKEMEMLSNLNESLKDLISEILKEAPKAPKEAKKLIKALQTKGVTPCRCLTDEERIKFVRLYQEGE